MTKFLVLLVATMLSLLAVGDVSAHVLKTDGTIGAVLHVKPDDNPQTGIPMEYVLSFQDTAGLFAVTDCDCAVSLVTGGQVIATQQLKAQGKRTGGNTVTFPKIGAYELKVSGVPKENARFKPFKFSYNLRASGGDDAREQQNIPPLLWLGMGTMIALVLLGATRLQD